MVAATTILAIIIIWSVFSGPLVRRGITSALFLTVAAFIGWFGPRGLASLVFALLALERGVPEGEVILTTVVVTVALSVILHGLTSVPLVAAYHRWYEGHAAEHPVAAEATPVTIPRRRRQFPGTESTTPTRDSDRETSCGDRDQPAGRSTVDLPRSADVPHHEGQPTESVK